ncbi:MAG: hypothetical protein ACI85K_000716 [Hyphomicrobiaceae bacterium]|jgi:hypothetical protein
MTRYDPFAYGEVRLDPNKQKQNGGSPPDADDLLFADTESVKQAPPADSSWAMLDEDIESLLPGTSPAVDESLEFGAEILGVDSTSDMPFEDPLAGEESLSLSDFDDASPRSLSLSDLDDASPSMQPLSEMMGDMPPGETMDHPVDQPLESESYEFDMAPALEQPPAEEPQPPAEEPQPPAREPQPLARDVMQTNAVLMPSVETGSTEPMAQPRKRREVRRRSAAKLDAEGEPQNALPGSLAAAEQAKAKSAALPGRVRLPALAAVIPLAVCAAGGTAASWFLVMQANPVMAGLIGATTLVSALFSWLFLRG